MHEKLEMLGFPVGTRVVMASEDPTGYVTVGQTGTVCHYTSDWEDEDGCNIGVEWDVGRPGFHNCMGRCRNTMGRYVPHTAIMPELFSKDLGEIEQPEFSIDSLLS